MDSPKDDVSYGNISDDTIVDYESLIKVIQPLLIIINSFFSHSFFFFFFFYSLNTLFTIIKL